MPTRYETQGYGPPFSDEEYRDRLRRVREEMERRGLDTLFVTSPPNLTYLTGYDSIWYDLPVITALVVRRDADDAIFFDTRFHRELVADSAYADEVVYHGGRGVRAIHGTLEQRGWLKGNVGIEKWSRSPAPPVLADLEQRFADAGANVVDGSWCVDRVKLVKMPSEIVYIRKAAEIADAAMVAVRDALRPGVTEKEIAGLAQYEMAKLGGEEPAIRTIVRSGPRTAAHHALPSMRQIQAGDIVGVDFCAVFNRYHVDLSRCFSIGQPDPRWTDMFEKIDRSIEVVKEQMRPGDPMSKLHAIANEYIDRASLRRYVWWIDGYDLGISTPPDWVGHTFLGGGRFEEANFDVGVVTNYENVIDVTEDNWPGGKGGNYIETLLMTEAGLETLSKLDRKITVV